jgi:hypothetical protein
MHHLRNFTTNYSFSFPVCLLTSRILCFLYHIPIHSSHFECSALHAATSAILSLLCYPLLCRSSLIFPQLPPSPTHQFLFPIQSSSLLSQPLLATLRSQPSLLYQWLPLQAAVEPILVVFSTLVVVYGWFLLSDLARLYSSKIIH